MSDQDCLCGHFESEHRWDDQATCRNCDCDGFNEDTGDDYAGDQVTWCASCQRWHAFEDPSCVDVPPDWPRLAVLR
jgi:hypothetical protein